MTSDPRERDWPKPVVRYADADPNGLANLIGRLMEANLDRRPERLRLLRPSVVALVAADADVSVTVRLRESVVEVANGVAGPGAHVSVVAGAQHLLALAAVPLRFGLPDPFRRSGLAAVRGILARGVRVSGMLRHPIMVSRFLRLLSVAR